MAQHSSEQILRSLIPELVRRVQLVYNQWDQSDEEFGDPDLGFGGFCQDIAEQIAGAVWELTNFEASTVSAHIGEQHVWTMVKTPEGVFSIDIPPSYYETGGGYNWQKMPGIEFDESFFVIDLVSADPDDFEEMTAE